VRNGTQPAQPDFVIADVGAADWRRLRQGISVARWSTKAVRSVYLFCKRSRMAVTAREFPPMRFTAHRYSVIILSFPAPRIPDSGHRRSDDSDAHDHPGSRIQSGEPNATKLAESIDTSAPMCDLRVMMGCAGFRFESSAIAERRGLLPKTRWPRSARRLPREPTALNSTSIFPATAVLS